MKKITYLNKIVLSISIAMMISGTMSFVKGQAPVTPSSHTECEYYIGSLTYSVRLLKGNSYQWYSAPYRSKIFTLIKGATSNVLTLTFGKGELLGPLTREYNGTQFKCLITPLLGEPAYSEVAYLYVNYRPSISAHPSGATKYAGESVTFTVTASGSLPRYYQWQLNMGGGYSDIPGATSSSYTIPVVVPGDAGDYRCVVTNDCGTAYSNGATLTVLEPLFSDGWFAQNSGTSKDIRQISAISKYNAWAVTSETDQLLHTIDGGDTWNTVYMVDAGANPLGYYGYCLWFSSSNNGYVGGWDGYAYTTNGGTTWTRKDVKDSIDLGASNYFYTYDIYFYTTSVGWIVGSDGLIAYTSDGGANWTKQNWGKDPDKVTDADLKCVYFLDSQNGWIGGANGVILATIDGGAHWTLQSAPEVQQVNDIHFVSATKGFAVANSYRALYTTDNAGAIWIKYAGTLPYIYPYAIDFVDINTGWMAGFGYKGGVYGGSILRTNDGGNTWYNQSVENPDYLYHLAMVDIDNGWAIGRAGSIQRTAYGGCLHPTMNLYDDQALCASSNYMIIADTFKQNDNVFYSWNTGATTGRITINETGTYSVIVTNLCGETATDTVNVQFYPLPVANAGEDVSICPGDTVQLNATGGSHYFWIPGYTLSVDTIQNPRAFPYATTTYTVSVSDTNSCVNTDQVTVTVPVPYGDEEICLVSVDPETEKNMVIWEKTPDAGIEYYYIYRESDVAGIYNIIGSVPVDSLSVFVDETSKPKEQQYLYKISAVDTCGSQSELSSYHKTILLQYDGSAGGVNLRWDKYEIEGIPINFDSYIIYRGSDSTKLTEVKTISASLTSWIDTDPVANSIKQYYRIAGVKGEVCDPANLVPKKAGTGPYSHSMSNIEDNRLQVGISDLRENANNLRIYPNPFRNQTRITYTLDKPSDVRIEIYNLLGARTADIVNIKQDPGEFTYDINAADMGVAEGVFYLRFTVNGNTTVKKLILTK